MCSGVSGTICGGNGGGIDELILLPRGGAAVLLVLEELRFLGFGDSCGGLRFAVFVVLVVVVSLLLMLLAVVAALIMVGSGARGR